MIDRPMPCASMPISRLGTQRHFRAAAYVRSWQFTFWAHLDCLVNILPPATSAANCSPCRLHTFHWPPRPARDPAVLSTASRAASSLTDSNAFWQSAATAAAWGKADAPWQQAKRAKLEREAEARARSERILEEERSRDAAWRQAVLQVLPLVVLWGLRSSVLAAVYSKRG